MPVEVNLKAKMGKTPNIVMMSLLFSSLIQVISARDMDCGVRNLAPDSGQFAISGDNTGDPDAPWTAAVGRFDPNARNIFEVRCSGVVITRRHVLTAAHCFKGQLEYVRVGVTYIHEDGSQDRKITSFHMHPDYNQTWNYDIMILELNEKLIFNEKVSALCLPEEPYDHPGDGRNIIIQGWG